jgi:hypothetical protein
LKPIRAGIACNLMGSRNTSIRQRCKAVRGNPDLAGNLVRPIWGVADAIKEKARAMQQQLLRGVGFARVLATG